MNPTTALFTSVLIVTFSEVGSCGRHFTSLFKDNVPCSATALKKQVNYVCTSNGNVVCNEGWTDVSKLCKTPVCNPACVNGECKAPNFCACNVGWYGDDCNSCITMPGCVNGNCSKALECNCFKGYHGSSCDIPKCTPTCVNGYCDAPYKCRCFNGWTGNICNKCVKLNGCQNGDCVNGSDCVCKSGWRGGLCDIPVCKNCKKPNGKCIKPNLCICELGWMGESCDQCRKAANCPPQYFCKKPNDCLGGPILGRWMPAGSCIADNGMNCGPGKMLQTRSCIDGPVMPCSQVQTRRSVSCSLPNCPRTFKPWMDSGPCSETCGQGLKPQTRKCTNGTVDKCTLALTTRVVPCNVSNCPKTFGPYVNTTACSQTCGNGTIVQKRTCIDGIGPENRCTDADRTRTMPCVLKHCPRYFSAWFNVGACSATCGRGLQLQRRDCHEGTPPAPKCSEAQWIRIIACNVQACPISW